MLFPQFTGDCSDQSESPRDRRMFSPALWIRLLTRSQWWAPALMVGGLLGITLPALADPEAADRQATPAGNAADLSVPSWFGVDYQTDGGGFRDFGSVEGWVPLSQTPGLDVWFLQGRARLSTAGDLGGNLMLGYRTLLPEQQKLLGGYLALDAQGTDEQTFYQLGTGFERISQGWELRSNFYFPLGDRATATTLTGGPFFQGNQLVLPTTRQVAMAGGDVEVGGAIADLGDLGALRAFGGLYYYGHSDVSGIWGGRAWLAAHPVDQLNVRLGLQHDGYWGTQVMLQTGFSWGRSTTSDDPDTLATALGRPIQRTMPIWLVEDDQLQAAAEPRTGRVYTFQHVRPGAVAGTGTFAAPYGEVTEAVAIAVDGDIVYVQPGMLNAGFTIPAGVQVVSTAVEYGLPTQFGRFALPGSGQGDLPMVPGTVVLGDRTRLSGFAIVAGPEQDGIQANGVDTVMLDHNQIQTARNGILLSQVSGDVAIEQNEIWSATQNGIFLSLAGQDNRAELNQNQVISAEDNGFLIQVTDQSQLNTLTLNNNQAISAAANGFLLLTEDNSQLGTVTLSQLQVEAAGANGLLVLSDSNSQVETLMINDLTVGTAGSNGVLVLADNGAQIDRVTLAEGQMAQSGGNGILILADNGGQLGPVSVVGNTVEQAIANGLAIIGDRATAIADITFSNNVIGTAEGNGLLIQANNGSTLSSATVAETAIGTADENGFLIAIQNGSQLASTTVENVQVGQAAANGGLVQADSGSQIAEVMLRDVQINRVGENGILLQADNGSQITSGSLMNGQVNNADQNGVLVLANNGSQISAATVEGYQVGGTDGAIAANGILLFADNGSTLPTSTIQNNQLSGIAGTGIQGFADGRSGLGTIAVHNNSLQAIEGGGVLVFADGQSLVREVAIAANQLSQVSREGIQVFADGEGQIAAVAIADNTVNNSDGNGIQVFAGNNAQIDAVQVTDNQLAAIAQDGIVAFAQTDGQLPSISMVGNQLSQVAQDGLRVFATNGGKVNAVTVSDNTTQAVGNTSVFAFADSTSQLSTLTLEGNRLEASTNHAVELGNAGSAPFCAAVRDNVSLDTANFDGNFFVNGTGPLQIVDLPQLNTNNNASFEQVNNSGATNGTSGAGICP